MQTPKSEKPFDCVAFKRRAQTKIYEETHAMIAEEQVAYFRKRALRGALGAWWQRVSATSEPLAVHESAARYSTKSKRR
jgi:pyridoxine/pyridoxamine 5'-phosphate oxidase